MAVYLHVLTCLSYDHILTIAGVYIYYALCMIIYIHLHTLWVSLFMCVNVC